MNSSDSTQRFSDRVDDYVKYRPSYPPEVLRHFQSQMNLRPQDVVVDVGSGTGISAEIFLRNGNPVLAVEPNDSMRGQAEKNLQRYPNFQSIKGTSEATTLQDRVADFVIAAQAFHWFEPKATRREFRRILKAGGYVAVIFNDRLTTDSDFSRAYEDLLNRFGTDYQIVKHRNVSEKRHREFLGDYQELHIPYAQKLNYESLLGRLKSSSYVPKEGAPRFREMTEELAKIFERTQQDGSVVMTYDTQVFWSQLA